jgi:hypothetical protein
MRDAKCRWEEMRRFLMGAKKRRGEELVVRIIYCVE